MIRLVEHFVIGVVLGCVKNAFCLEPSVEKTSTRKSVLWAIGTTAMWPILFLYLLLCHNPINWENRPAIQKAILIPLEWTKNLKVQTNQRTAIAQTLGTIYNHLGTNEEKISAIISRYNYQTENLTPKLQPQITRFASINSTNEPGKLEFGRNCREKSTFKITINQNNKFNCYQL